MTENNNVYWNDWWLLMKINMCVLYDNVYWDNNIINDVIENMKTINVWKWECNIINDDINEGINSRKPNNDNSNVDSK